MKTTTAMSDPVAKYLDLPYTIELVRDPGGGWYVSVRELPGCMSQGDTPEDALQMIRDAMRAWIEVALAEDETIPEPRAGESYSGKFVVRVPRTLHRRLVEAAARDGVSLNQFVSVALAGAVGLPRRPAADGARPRHTAPRPAGGAAAPRGGR